MVYAHKCITPMSAAVNETKVGIIFVTSVFFAKGRCWSQEFCS